MALSSGFYHYAKGNIKLEPFSMTPGQYYVWVGSMIAGRLNIDLSREMYPDGPVVEIHWRGLQAMEYEDFEHLKQGIAWLRRCHRENR